MSSPRSRKATIPTWRNADRADARHPEEAALRARRQRPAHDEQLEAETADDEREREEVQPADDVLGPRRPLRADRVRHRRRRHADAERVDAGDDVAVVRQRLPAHRVRALRQLRQRRRRSRAAPGSRAASRRRSCPSSVSTWIAFGSAIDALVELEHDLPRRPRELLLERRATPSRSDACANAAPGSARAASAAMTSARLIGASARRTARGGRRSEPRRGRSRGARRA